MNVNGTSKFASGRTTILPPFDDDLKTPPSPCGDRFVEDGLLGTGGAGEVVRALDLDIGRRVAIKRIRPDRRDDINVARFVREVRLVGALEHPNIVPLHDVGGTGTGDIYAVMKWIDGQSLHDLIDRLRAGDPVIHERFSFDARMRLFLEVCRGIAYAHQRGILHRDIKPGNIMLGVNGEVQIVDWGLAKIRRVPTRRSDLAPLPEDGLADETVAGSICGTPCYMAPEQARGTGYDERSEVFALGLLLWELLTLEPPGSDDTTLQDAIEEARVRRVPFALQVGPNPVQGPVPANLAWLIDRAVQPNPADRHPTVQALIDDVQSTARGAFDIKCTYSLQQFILAAVSRWHDRHPKAFTYLAIGALLGLIGLGVALGGATVLAALML